MAMTKKEFITKTAERLIQCPPQSMDSNVLSVINEVKLLTYDDSKKISTQDQLDIFRGVKEKLSSVVEIKKAQESTMLTQSINSVLEYLRPAISKIDAEIEVLSQQENRESEEKAE